MEGPIMKVAFDLDPTQASSQFKFTISRNSGIVWARFEDNWDFFVKFKLQGGGSVIFIQSHIGWTGSAGKGSASPVRISLSALGVFEQHGLATAEELEGFRAGVVPGEEKQGFGANWDVELMLRAMLKGVEFAPVCEQTPLGKLYGEQKALTAFTVRPMSQSQVLVVPAQAGLPVLTLEARALLQQELKDLG
jgi:hypothetical protein